MTGFLSRASRLFGQKVDPVEPSEAFDPAHQTDADEILRLRMRRPMVAGGLFLVALVIGAIVWATVFHISGAVVAPGTVRVEDNVKQVRYRDGGVVRQILVREGQLVRRGQVLLRFDRVTAGATVDVLRSGYDSALAQRARFEAEARGAADVSFPAELTSQSADPQVDALLSGQRSLFFARMTLYRSQAEVLRGQADQLRTQIAGQRAQMASADAQSGLIDDELRGVADLNKLGYAPRSRLLSLQRGAAQLKGQRGSIEADIGRATQAIGDVNLQIAQLTDKRQTDAADGLRDAQERIADLGPKLRAAQEALGQTTVVAPVTGYVFNLTQYTEGGVAQPGEVLMQVVPTDRPLEVTVMVRPNDIAEVRQGMPARITLTAYNPRTTPQVDGTVSLVSADATIDEATKATFFKVQVKVTPQALAAAGPSIHLTPGMPATVAIVTGSRTIMDYLLGPLTEGMRGAMKER